ncbi:MAG: LpqB family beta-propeller domain-containing protein [Nocardioides sp.]|nr:LpqB family beta-propeller domain-containing protein [Nocardioides sp.]
MSRRTPVRALAALLAAGVLSACVGMPTEGPVVESKAQPDTDNAPGISFDPRPPQPGESAVEIVGGFLEAMKAAQVKPAVARQFLTARARERWTPERSIVTYDDLGTASGEGTVSLVATEVDHYDERGAWRRSQARHALQFVMAREDGQWRIDRAPDALVVPASWFDDWYQRASTYFFDPTSRILVPEPVYVPRGDQMASALVRSLLSLPGDASSRVVRSYFPPDTTRGLSVPISAAGVAEVSLGGDGSLTDEESARRMLTQLVWTLRQVPSVRAVELRIGDRAITTSSGSAQTSLDMGSAFDPVVNRTAADLHALEQGRLVRGQLGELRATTGPLGAGDLDLVEVSVNLSGDTAAGVTAERDALLVGRVEAADPSAALRSPIVDGVGLQAPAWDHLDRMWVLERRGGAARVWVIDGDDVRRIDVPGISGLDVRRLLVSRDGTRVVGLVRGPKVDRLVTSRVLQNEAGRVLRMGPAQALALTPEGSPRLRDLVWRSSSTVSVLSDITDDLSEVRTVSVDGSPGEQAPGGASRLRGRARDLVASPVESAVVYAIGGRVVTDLLRPERELPLLPEGIRSITYPG